MSPTSASGGASALYGAGLIICSAARARASSSVTAMAGPPDRRVVHAGRRASVVGVLEGRLAVLVEGADALDAVRMDGRPPVHVHHGRDRLLDRLSLAELDRPLDGLHRRRRVARDLPGDTPRGVHQLVLRVELVD